MENSIIFYIFLNEGFPKQYMTDEHITFLQRGMGMMNPMARNKGLTK